MISNRLVTDEINSLVDTLVYRQVDILAHLKVGIYILGNMVDEEKSMGKGDLVKAVIHLLNLHTEALKESVGHSNTSHLGEGAPDFIQEAFRRVAQGGDS